MHSDLLKGTSNGIYAQQSIKGVLRMEYMHSDLLKGYFEWNICTAIY